MTDYDTSTHTASELVRLVTGHLDVIFTERESDYRGVYHLDQGTYGRIEIQPNAIPGDDDQDDLYTRNTRRSGSSCSPTPRPQSPPCTPARAPSKVSCTWAANHGEPLLTHNS
ncbi:hypothetical protein [Streptomyces sp. D2-8]|uniref:hypothetical protein n=1 Tax=Streptomyces sp. D2-8 TaxID=2707767 RepID=UPI0020C0913E|nr:hypothetical protein [Streptomyces sp. D2-8]